MEKFSGTIFADYYQILLQDLNATDDLSRLWTPQAVKNLLAVGNDAIGIGTVRNLDVPVTLEVSDGVPAINDQEYFDQIVECSLYVPSGKVVVMGVTDFLPNAPTIEVAPGYYRVRILYANLGSVTEDGLDGEDSYRIEMWPDGSLDKGVLFHKRYRSQ